MGARCAGEKGWLIWMLQAFAFERAWKVYSLINKGVHENDERRTTLDRFIRKRRDAGAELLVVEGLKYLKRLDQSEGGSAE
jgi:hypothetical protein